MATVQTPLWTWDALTTVIPGTNLPRGATLRGTIYLGTAYGAFLGVLVGHGSSVALTNGVDVLINRTFQAGTIFHPGSVVPFLSTPTAANVTFVNANGVAGGTTLLVGSVTGFAAGDQICIIDGPSGTSFARQEWARVSKVATGTIVTSGQLQYAHTAAQADVVTNKADAFAPVWVPPGALYEVIFDYGDDTAGDAAQVRALAQVYQNDTGV